MHNSNNSNNINNDSNNDNNYYCNCTLLLLL